MAHTNSTGRTRLTTHNDLRMVSAELLHSSIRIAETSMGATTELIYDSAQCCRTLRISRKYSPQLSNLFNASEEYLPDALENYLYSQDSYLADLMDTLDRHAIPYDYAVDVKGAAGQYSPT